MPHLHFSLLYKEIVFGRNIHTFQHLFFKLEGLYSEN